VLRASVATRALVVSVAGDVLGAIGLVLEVALDSDAFANSRVSPYEKVVVERIEWYEKNVCR